MADFFAAEIVFLLCVEDEFHSMKQSKMTPFSPSLSVSCKSVQKVHIATRIESVLDICMFSYCLLHSTCTC